jgi:hypothetical protein
MPGKPTNIIHCTVMTLALIACDRQQGPEVDDEAEASEAEADESETEAPVDTEESESESESESGIFVPDIGEEVTPACDPFAQDCPSGEKCVPWASSGDTWDANKCVPVTGDGQPGDTCSSGGATAGTDSCAEDSICWDVKDVDGELIGVCTEFCSGSANDPICGPQTSCVIANEGSITLCIATCDPLLQDCAEGLGCFWANEDFNCVFTTDEIPTGEPCGYINDCAPGNLCADASALPSCGGSACCAPYCDLLAPKCGGLAQTECVTFFEEGLAPPGYEDVGICLLPG